MIPTKRMLIYYLYIFNFEFKSYLVFSVQRYIHPPWMQSITVYLFLHGSINWYLSLTSFDMGGSAYGHVQEVALPLPTSLPRCFEAY